MKQCFKCLRFFPLQEFYTHSEMADGHLNKCKSCTKEDVKNAYKANMLDRSYRLKERQRGRSKWHRLYKNNHPQDNTEAKKRWARNNLYKKRAQDTLHRAIKKGTIIRPRNCMSCGKKCKPEAHHEDYSKPLDVLWFCTTCHGLARHKLD